MNFSNEDYLKEVEARWGNTPEYKEFKEKNKEGLKNMDEKFMNLFAEFGPLKNLSADSKEVQEKVKELQDYITNNYYTCTNEILKNLGQMYVNDERFKQNIDNIGGEGTAEFVNDAIMIYCSK